MSNDARRAYEHGEKPSQADYANGLDKFFSVGDRRLTPNGNGGYTLETWSGSEWVAEGVKLSGREKHLDSTTESKYNYTQEQYESFGWAREAGGITASELDDLFAKIQVSSSLSRFKRSSVGEAIVEVNNDPRKALGIDNVFVFVKGTRDSFHITRIVRFFAETET